MAKTKKSLIASGLAIVVCLAMLIGTTFAWFTDSVTNKGNHIQAGTLDIGATVAPVTEGTTYEINGKTFDFGAAQDIETLDGAIINETNWEPGQSNAKLLTVTNKGSLAAKIKLHFTVTDGGLMNALWFDFVQVTDEGQSGQFTKRPMNTLEQFAEAPEFSLASGESISFILMYGMYEEAGNVYQGKEFTADVSIIAKQDTVETDGFGSDQYDKDAEYAVSVSDEDSLTEALKAGKPVALEQDIQIDTVVPQSASGDTNIDLNGHTLTISAGGFNATVEDGDTVTIENGTVRSDSTNLDFGVQAGGTLNLQNVEYVGPGFQPGGQDATVNIVDSKLEATSYYIVSTNASVTGGEVPAAGVCINIINSELDTTAVDNDNSCVLFNVPGELNIVNSTLTSDRQAVIVRGGTAKIENSTLKTTGLYTGADHLNDTWGSGNEVPEAALVVGNRSAGAYKYPASCTLVNTTLIAEDGAFTAYVYGISSDLSATLTYDTASTVGEVQLLGDGAFVNKA